MAKKYTAAESTKNNIVFLDTDSIMQRVSKATTTLKRNKKLVNFLVTITRVSRYVWQNRWLRFALLCLPVVVYYLPTLLTGNKEAPGDPDYYFALYEAFRRDVLIFHQFPWWDPWIAGGVPLFGNIQFGLISISSPLVLLFGTPMGLKLSLVIYGIIAFFGMKRLLMRYFQTSEVRAIALAYIFTFCGFFAARAYMGHFTFPLAAFTPWVLYYYLYIHERHAWIKFALVLGLFVDTAPHYTAIMTSYLLTILFIIEVFHWRRRPDGKVAVIIFQSKERFFALLKAAGLFLIVTGYRLFYVIDFFKDYQRKLDLSTEKFTTIKNGFLAMWDSPNFVTAPSRGLIWSWGEIETYISIGTFFAICLILAAWVLFYRKNFKQQFSRSIVVMTTLFIIFFALGMGYFSRYSPYGLAQYLPLFSAMRVATRWIFWAACIVILIIGAYKGAKFARTITFFCILGAIELLIIYPNLISKAYFMPTYQYRSATAPFYEERFNHVPRPSYANNAYLKKQYWFDQNLYESTQNNIGEPLASDSLLYKTWLGQTYRCIYIPDRTPCPFVMTHNANVTYWSPNHITLVRTGPGVIKLDMNPGAGWRVNDKYIFEPDGSVSATAWFQFGNDNAKSYDIEYAPRLSPSWFAHEFNRVTHLF